MAFEMPEGLIDFNTAGLSRTTLAVNQLLVKNMTWLNQLPSRHMNIFRRLKKQVKLDLAEEIGCPTEEIALCRNATEALATSIFGIPLEAGDEVIVSPYDYPHIYYAWKQREARDGIILKYADLAARPKSPKQIRKLYLAEVSKRTRAIQLTDLYNCNGCWVPSRDIIKRLPQHVRFRILDAAQSLCNAAGKIADRGATHMGASLHKWVGAPVGTGVLQVKEDVIKETWPLFASDDPYKPSISKFEHQGTKDLSVLACISASLAFQKSIGVERKSKRLDELANYFRDKVKETNGLELVSANHKDLRSNLVLFSVKDKDPQDVVAYLWKKHNIHTVKYDWFDVHGIRVSFNVYNLKSEIDQLIMALTTMN